MGGSYNNTSNAGASALNVNNPRTNVNANIGFFSAYLFSQKGECLRTFSQRKKRKGIYSRSGSTAGKIDVAVNAVSTGHEAGRGLNVRA